ncbi:MAG: hypothetical protein N3A66_03900, partial [Planctomycetota bacterium]|nr:hypothetical protein [Planctomycetota bacterium]
MEAKRFEITCEVEFVSATFQHLAMRIAAQMEFAAGLAELHPSLAGRWQALINRSQETVQPALASGSVRELGKAVAEAEEMLAPIAKVAKDYCVILAGHAHIDMNWMWAWPETCAVTNDTFTTVLRLMEEYPDFHFSQSQASVYALIEEHNPELFERIREKVRAGRWEITASHWVEGDKNLAAAESLCRHLLYTRKYFQERFGLTPEDIPIDWSPDTFGHAATIPVYLQRGSIKYYYGHRFGNDVPERPPVFWWEGPDGSRVLVRNDCRNGYNGVIDESLGRRLLDYTKETGLRTFLFVFGVGDHGGGPTRRDICRALDMQQWPVFPEIRFGTAREFFTRIEKEAAKCRLPVLRGELNFEFTGCYTSQSLIKKANRFAEAKLVDAEIASSLAWAILGAAYPAARLRQAWQDTLFCHFHDILPGSGVHDTRTYCHGLFQKTAATASMVETNALRLLAARVDTTAAGEDAKAAMPPPFLQNGVGAGVGFDTSTGNLSAAEMSAGSGPRPFLVFNPCGHARQEVVTAMVWDNDPGAAILWRRSGHGTRLQYTSWQVVGPEGRAAAAQVLDSGHYWGHQYVRLAFATNEIPALGYGLYILKEGEAAAPQSGVRFTGPKGNCCYAPLEHLRLGMENGLIAMEVDPATGGIRSLRDLRRGLEILDSQRPAGLLGFAVERPHRMT